MSDDEACGHSVIANGQRLTCALPPEHDGLHEDRWKGHRIDYDDHGHAAWARRQLVVHGVPLGRRP